MQDMLFFATDTVLAWLALPGVGLSAIFLVSTLAATLLPLGSEPILFAYVREVPDMYWPAILVATAGNTLGGVISYAMGRGARRGYEAWKARDGEMAGAAPTANDRDAGDRWHRYARSVLDRFGPPAMLLAWLPAIGDPLCAVAGWLRFAFWPSLVYMAIGKFVRYLTITGALVWLFPGGG
ncbi:DedA family protein [Verticiella sediminum]|uniref:DedA family protein n=1 Tax=Verticiella sediminum TaxID=1247510 RepID=A0A556ALQ8_9BURK|nr:YqaA family protein [Verticiella sediminum]TSH93829.1 DedA family protein [Verticiella sediminum]